MALAQEQIEAIRGASDIAAVIGAEVALRKSGRHLVGICPFHAEKTPSFSVTPERGLYYCFGCQAGGDVFAFVMQRHRVDFQEAARRLAARAGIMLAPESAAVRAKRAAQARAVACNAAAQAWFVAALWSPAGVAARGYLEARRVPARQARARALGAGGDAEAFVAHMAAAGFAAAALREAGLLPAQGERPLFAQRLVFPIHDAEGRVVGFGGRRLGDDAGAGPKYVNSADSACFSKGRALYGLQVAAAACRRSQSLVLVEGYTDVLAAQQAGIETAVAALGTAFSAGHAQLCRQLAPRLVVALDGDAAGARASFTACCHSTEAGLQTLVAELPAGLDPDALVRQRGSAALRHCIEAARPALETFIAQRLGDATQGVEARAEAARGLAPLLFALGPGIERELYTSRIASRVGLSVEQLQQHLQPPRRRRRRRDAVGDPANGQGHANGHGYADGDGFGDSNGGGRGDDADGDSHADSASYADSGSRTDGHDRGRRGHGNGGADSADDAHDGGANQPTGPEIEMLCELLLHPALRARCGELAEYAMSPAMQAILDALAGSQAPLAEVLAPYALAPRIRARLARIRSVTEAPDDEALPRSERTFNDVLIRLKRLHLEQALAEVLQALRDAEGRGEATDLLLRRKQMLTARKRALRSVHYAVQQAKIAAD